MVERCFSAAFVELDKDWVGFVTADDEPNPNFFTRMKTPPEGQLYLGFITACFTGGVASRFLPTTSATIALPLAFR